MLEADIIAEAEAEDPRSPADLQLCCVHEAGHAIAAVMLGLHVEGVSVRDGGARGGNTRLTVRRLFLSADDVHDQVVALLSGRAAEQVLLGHVTSGAGGGSGSDLQRATWLAASAVAELGLDPDHGLAWTPLPEREAELTATLAADARLAACVRQRLDDAYEDALALIRRSADAVAVVAKALIDRRSLDAAGLRQIAGVARDHP